MVVSRQDLIRVLAAIAPDPVLGAVSMNAIGYVEARLAAEGANWLPAVEEGLVHLSEASLRAARVPFADIDDRALTELVGAVANQKWFVMLTRWVAEAIYANPGNGGNPGAKSWREVGYRHGLPEGPDGPSRKEPFPEPERELAARYDAIIVGAGAGGSIVAAQLALAGRKVLLVERGRRLDYHNSGHRDHLRNHRHPVYGHNTGPDREDGLRVLVRPDGSEALVEPHTVEFGNNAACVGSGTLIYGGLAWRFHPDDFRMASKYGVPDGSSLVDWPIGYDDLEPWYEMAEHEIGVCGPQGAMPHESKRRRNLPMPPLPRYASARVLERGGQALGLETFPPPVLVNSVPRAGRAACMECGSCVGFACPSDGKNGTQNTVLPRALATGNLTLVAETTVEKVLTASNGRVAGVAMAWDDAGEIERREIGADIVVLSAGAIETARLLMLSNLANESGHLGRHLQGHTYPTAFGLFDDEVYAERGPGVTIATTAYAHDNPGIVGGAMLADDFIIPPAIFWDQALPPDLPRWGQAPHDFMRHSYRRVTQVKGPVHEVPSPQCRVELDPTLTDKWGRPVARLSGVVHPETQRTTHFLLERACEWLVASGATKVWGHVPAPRLSAYQHQAGTCRMGDDPAHSVTDPFGRVWGHDNVFVADASLHPTNGGFNPVLTVMALAFRSADHILSTL
ncbi:GMC family oxidoreductase [Pelagibacterium sp. H642]|uniref:GMC family oxidoreductase n=1 Tax=Pelagibacterium sp. H642 TaxID=1881069 RepID=UPI0028164AAB|nr:GMC family oxidoreductase [Pelagibacterium sp. H642]WMT90408.1 GMC family oxidoreductase [Pelagibacterium sp. H642]